MKQQSLLSQVAGGTCLAVASLLTIGCGGAYREVPKSPSHALAKHPATGVASQLANAARQHHGKSGFALLEGNREAYSDRVALADFATKTLDVQYYIWSADTAGLMLADHLIRAADRGVRVRFLLDDVNFKNRDSSTAELAAHPNIEVRIFNPHHSRSSRMLEFLSDFERLNKRMHNKVMVMDNTCAIVGGRNIADHYFGLDEDYNYRDLDIAAIGPVVQHISNTFDEYWNSDSAVPLEAFVRKMPDMVAFRTRLAEMRRKIRPERYPFPLENDVAALRRRVDEIVSNMTWAEGEVIHDTYASTQGDDPAGKMNARLYAEVAAARKDVRMEAAYFVLRDQAVSLAGSLVRSGVKVRVLTNALAGNDVVAAQAGHTKRRSQVLRAGVEVFELRPDAAALEKQVAPHARSARAALHTKAMVIDGRISFVGSFNFDPRSADINSEIGLLVHSEAFARKVGAFLDEGVSPENAYRVILDEKGRTRWKTIVGGQERTWSHDPETSLTRRALNRLFTLLPIEDQL